MPITAEKMNNLWYQLSNSEVLRPEPAAGGIKRFCPSGEILAKSKRTLIFQSMSQSNRIVNGKRNSH